MKGRTGRTIVDGGGECAKWSMEVHGWPDGQPKMVARMEMGVGGGAQQGRFDDCFEKDNGKGGIRKGQIFELDGLPFTAKLSALTF